MPPFCAHVSHDTSKSSGSTDNSTYKIRDTTKPFIVLNIPYPEDNVSYGNVLFNWTAVDNSDFNLTCDLLIGGQITQPGITSQNNISTLTYQEINIAGYYNWSVNCTDYDGNFNISETRSFTVIRGPDDISINISSDNSSIELNWTFVTNADSYNIYISTNYTAGFPGMPNITGITDLNWTDFNGFDSERRYYKVATVKGDAEALSEKTAGKHTTLLQTTWNLLSIPFNLTNWLLNNGSNNGRDIFTQPSSCINTLWRFNSSNQSYERTDYSGIWQSGSESEFTYLEHGRGYWAEVNTDCNITFYGIVPGENKTYILNEYWNVMGHYSVKDPLLEDESIMKPIDVFPDNSVSSILRYDMAGNDFEVTVHYPGYGFFPSFNNPGFIYLNPMKGYFFDNTQEANWTHDPTKG